MKYDFCKQNISRCLALVVGFQTAEVVYHDDVGDYSTNEPIMDGTANLSYLLAAMASRNP